MELAVFFPGRGEDPRPGLEVCKRCPVSDECADYVATKGAEGIGVTVVYGIWGARPNADDDRWLGTAPAHCPRRGTHRAIERGDDRPLQKGDRVRFQPGSKVTVWVPRTSGGLAPLAAVVVAYAGVNDEEPQDAYEVTFQDWSVGEPLAERPILVNVTQMIGR